MRIKYALVLLLLGVGIYIVHTPRDLVAPEIAQLRSFPSHIGRWAAVRDTVFNEPTLKALRPTDYLMRTYENPDGDRLSIYIGYHDGGPSSGPIHSPRNCLPSSGWVLAHDQNMRVPVGGDTVNLVRADFTKDGGIVTYYYWYQIQGETIAKDIAMKFSEFSGMLLRRRKDASFIRIGLLHEDPVKGDALLRDFLVHAYPSLKKHLPS